MTKSVEDVKSVWTSDEGTMARETAISRWPRLVQNMIDDVSITGAKLSPSSALDEIKSIQRELEYLKSEIINDDKLHRLNDDASADISAYNQILDDMGRLTWLNCPWLYGECYMYRRVQLLFSMSSSWKDYDIFMRQKNSALAKSRRSIEDFAIKYIPMIASPEKPLKSLDEETDRLVFIDMIQLALWGNAADLSLITDLSVKEMQAFHGRAPQENVVDNDASEVWDYLGKLRTTTSKRHIDIILDNAGFELFTDLLFVAYLFESGLATSITLHVKSSPWFVSDVVPNDISFLLEYIQSMGLRSFATMIQAYIDRGSMRIETDPFWTTAFSFHEMEAQAPELFQHLRDSDLTIWKGDLNYRKLTRDGLWPHTTAFKSALGCLGQGSKVKVLALRTNKSDTCVGIDSEEKVASLDREAPGKSWIRDGTYGVVSFSDGL